MEVLQNYSTAELIAILIAVFVGVKGFYEGVMWILDRLNIYHNVRSKNEKLEQSLKDNTEQIIQINEKLKETAESISRYFEITKIQFRHSIVRAAEEYIARGFIFSYELESIEDLYQTYHEVLNGNSYVTVMMEKVRTLPIRNEM